jgi:RIO kinase 1
MELTAERQVDEAVFQQAFIPRKLEEVEHFERDAERLAKGETRDIYFPTLTGMAADGTGAGLLPKALLGRAGANVDGQRSQDAKTADVVLGSKEVDSECTEARKECCPEVERGLTPARGDCASDHGTPSDSEDSEALAHEDSQSSDVSASGDQWQEREQLTPEEIKEARKANKQAVKAQQRERRLTKVPKKVKKRAEKKGKVKK